MTGNENHEIDLDTASEWTANYRATISSGDILGNYFGATTIKSILDQDGCVGIRIYYAINDDNAKCLVVTGVDSDGNDICEGILAERAVTNPPYTVAPNPLNS